MVSELTPVFWHCRSCRAHSCSAHVSPCSSSTFKTCVCYILHVSTWCIFLQMSVCLWVYKTGRESRQCLCSDPYGEFSPKEPQVLAPPGALSDSGSSYSLHIPHSTSSKIFLKYFLQVLFRLASEHLTLQACFCGRKGLLLACL